ncbi:hypothetical protein D3C81_1374630 [compost metagenome]
MKKAIAAACSRSWKTLNTCCIETPSICGELAPSRNGAVNEPITPMNTKVRATRNVLYDRGKINLANSLNLPAPTSLALSMTDEGIPANAELSSIVVNGMLNQRFAIMIPFSSKMIRGSVTPICSNRRASHPWLPRRLINP